MSIALILFVISTPTSEQAEADVLRKAGFGSEISQARIAYIDETERRYYEGYVLGSIFSVMAPHLEREIQAFQSAYDHFKQTMSSVEGSTRALEDINDKTEKNHYIAVLSSQREASLAAAKKLEDAVEGVGRYRATLPLEAFNKISRGPGKAPIVGVKEVFDEFMPGAFEGKPISVWQLQKAFMHYEKLLQQTTTRLNAVIALVEEHNREHPDVKLSSDFDRQRLKDLTEYTKSLREVGRGFSDPIRVQDSVLNEHNIPKLRAEIAAVRAFWEGLEGKLTEEIQGYFHSMASEFTDLTLESSVQGPFQINSQWLLEGFAPVDSALESAQDVLATGLLKGASGGLVTEQLSALKASRGLIAEKFTQKYILAESPWRQSFEGRVDGRLKALDHALNLSVLSGEEKSTSDGGIEVEQILNILSPASVCPAALVEGGAK